jgi:hypothetical protein
VDSFTFSLLSSASLFHLYHFVLVPMNFSPQRLFWIYGFYSWQDSMSHGRSLPTQGSTNSEQTRKGIRASSGIRTDGRVIERTKAFHFLDCLATLINSGARVYLKQHLLNVAIFCDTAPFSPYVNRRFGRKYHFLLQGSKPTEQRN